jgi:hypothetical protein
LTCAVAPVTTKAQRLSIWGSLYPAAINRVYFDSPYYVYPDGPIAVEALRVIGAAMAEAGLVGLGRLTLSRRERMVMVEPRGTGMALFTLRAAGEVRAPQFGSTEGDLDPEMVAIAGSIVRQRTGNFDPGTYRDRYQEALQQLIEAKMRGLTIKPRAVSTPSPVIYLMAALKLSLAKEPPVPERKTAKRKRTKQAPDRRQPALLLPLTRDRKRNQRASADPVVTSIEKRKKGRNCVALLPHQDTSPVTKWRRRRSGAAGCSMAGRKKAFAGATANSADRHIGGSPLPERPA